MRRLADEQQWLDALDGLRKARQADVGNGEAAASSPTSST